MTESESKQGLEFKSGFAAIVGRPNVGKSTLMNCLLHEKIAIISAKPQTTRNKILGILTDISRQIIFIDTPGIHSPKSKLGEYMVKSAESAVRDVDCILFLVEASSGTNIHGADLKIIENLKRSDSPVILVINKIDLCSKPDILGEIDKYKSIGIFKEIVPVSAMKDENTEELLKTVEKYIPKGPKYFPGDTMTDQPERQLAAEIIREKALYLLQDEIPHGVAVEIEAMRKRAAGSEIVDVEAVVYCERDSHKGIIIGKKGELLKKIGSMARVDMERLFGSKIYLQIWVKVKKDWRNSDILVKNFGYDPKQL